MSNPATTSTLHKPTLARLLIALHFLSKYCSTVPVALNVSVVFGGLRAKDEIVWESVHVRSSHSFRGRVFMPTWPTLS